MEKHVSHLAETIHVTRSPHEPPWPLRVRSGPGTAILGWRGPERVDAGVPDAVARSIAAALCAIARVTFCHDPLADGAPTNAWRADRDCAVQSLRPPLAARLTGTPTFPLVSTTHPEVAVRLFESQAWTLGGQVVLLSSGDPPPLTHAQIHRITRAREAALEPLVAGTGCVALVSPGPDGDFVELAFADEAALTDALAAIAREASKASLAFVEETEAAFFAP
jgi:hypothetical protein